MTTVGYGDYAPSTWPGRLLVILSCFFGVFVVSMIIVAIANLLKFESNELSIFLILDRIDLMADKDLLATRLVSKWVRLFKNIKKDKESFNKDKEKHKDELQRSLFKFKDKINEINSTFPSYSSLDNVQDNLFFLEKALTLFDNKFISINGLVDRITTKLEEEII